MHESLRDAYKTLSDYDRHYSSVRSALATFLFSLSYGSAAFLFKDISKPFGTDNVFLVIATILPILFAIAAFLLSCHFQRLTYTCRIYMEGIENTSETSGELETKTDPQNEPKVDLKEVRTNLDILTKNEGELDERARAHKKALLKALGKKDKDAPKFLAWDAPNQILALGSLLLFFGCLILAFHIPNTSACIPAACVCEGGCSKNTAPYGSAPGVSIKETPSIKETSKETSVVRGLPFSAVLLTVFLVGLGLLLAIFGPNKATRAAGLVITLFAGGFTLFKISKLEVTLELPKRPPISLSSSSGFSSLGAVGPFQEGESKLKGESEDCSGDDMKEVCKNFFATLNRTSIAILVIGSADKRSLKEELKQAYGGNGGLARSRAEYVIQRLSTAAGPNKTKTTFIPLITGPAWHGPVSDPRREEDRKVRVYAIWGSSEENRD